MDPADDAFDRQSTQFYQSEEAQELFTRNVVEKFWHKIDSLVDVDELVYDIISDLECADYLEYNEDDTDDKDKLRDLVLHRLGYSGYYE